MAHEPVTEEELRRICFDAASRGEHVGHILNDYLYLSFLHEQHEADRAANHRDDASSGDAWIATGAPRPAGRHRLAG